MVQCQLQSRCHQVFPGWDYFENYLYVVGRDHLTTLSHILPSRDQGTGSSPGGSWGPGGNSWVGIGTAKADGNQEAQTVLFWLICFQTWDIIFFSCNFSHSLGYIYPFITNECIPYLVLCQPSHTCSTTIIESSSYLANTTFPEQVPVFFSIECFIHVSTSWHTFTN